MNPEIKVEVLSDQDFEDLIAEGYIDEECLVIVSQESGFASLDVEFLPRRDGKPWRVKYAVVIELLQKCKDRLWELRRVPPKDGGKNE
jgi:hypothetical protein